MSVSYQEAPRNHRDRAVFKRKGGILPREFEGDILTLDTCFGEERAAERCARTVKIH